jgi:hypothetical protein
MQANLTEEVANPNVAPKLYSAFWFRFFEIFPGALAWTALISPFIFAYYIPLAVTIFIIIFDVYWLLRSVSYAWILVAGYRNMKRNLHTNWQGELKKLEDVSPEDKKKASILDWQEIYHAIIVTNYKEEQAILESSIDSIVAAEYPKNHILVILATEERDAVNARIVAANLTKRYEGKFFRFLVSEHPDGIVGEVKAKGANATWAAKKLTKVFTDLGIPLDHVIVSTADADTRFPKQYFSCLSYNYAVTPDRTRASFQPIATFFNNIWQAPMLSRVLAFGTTFWHLVESMRSYRLLTFSTHATSLQTLKEIDYWCTSVVNEDSRQFFRSFFKFGGKFRVVPLFIPIYMDAVHVENYWDTIRNLYFQQQRWAYGVEHFPYIVLESLRHPEIPFFSRLVRVVRAFEGAFSWATTSFYITVVGWLPLLLNNRFKEHIVASNFPHVTKLLLEITWSGLLVAGFITMKLLPPRPKNVRASMVLTMVIQWALIPFTAIFFGAIPGIDAQTRLMLGKYLGFRVTKKKAVSNGE